MLYSQCSESFKIYGANITAKEVLGITKFNDVGLYWETKKIIDNLTDDTSTYFLRMGTIRLDQYDFNKGTKNLFNLSYSANGNYPVLDHIDFDYYKRFGFEKMELDNPSLTSDTGYINFKKYIINSKSDSLTRIYLWNIATPIFRNKLLQTRFFINSQPISDNKKIKKHFSFTGTASLKANLSKMLKGVSNANLSAGIGAYIDNIASQNFNVTGHYVSIVFQEEYINQICYVLANTNDSELKDDEFSVNLKEYLSKTDSNVALNSGILFFQFTGSYNKSVINKDSISANLQGTFGLSPTQALSIGTTINLSWAKQLEENYDNSFSKVWIIRFGTHYRLDDSLHLRSTEVRSKTIVNKEIQNKSLRVVY